MANVTQLSETEIAQGLHTLTGWQLHQGKLYKEYTFPDFVRAFAFMTQVAIAAEVAGHHPEWFNVYNTVKIYLTTHDAGGISQKDFDLAQQIDVYFEV